MKKFLALLSMMVLVGGPFVSAEETTVEEAAEETTVEGEATEAKGDVVGETFEHEGIEVTIDKLYLTDERDKYSDKEYENVLVIEYTVKNNTKKEYYTGSDFALYVDGVKAEDYYFNNKSDTVSAGRKAKSRVAFGFDDEAKDMELEFANTYSYDGEPAVVIPLEEVEKDPEAKEDAQK